jgi:plasmid stabilization system protein ParE
MTRVVVTEPAKRDVRNILSDLSERASYRIAARYADEFKTVYRRLREVPATGAPRSKLGPNCRIAIVLPYLVVYDYNGNDDEVTVLRVLHGRRNITRSLIRR